MVPWQAPVERWLLEQYPIAWLSLRTFAWVAFPGAMLVGIVAAAVALWHFPDEDTAGAILGYAGFLACALVISVRAFVDRTVKAERETRMNEVIHPLPIRARRVAMNRLIECAFWVSPSLVLLGLTATVVACPFIHWQTRRRTFARVAGDARSVCHDLLRITHRHPDQEVIPER